MALINSECPVCDEVFDLESHLLSYEELLFPKPNDVITCAKCTAVLRFDPRMELVELTDFQISGLDKTKLREIMLMQWMQVEGEKFRIENVPGN